MQAYSMKTEATTKIRATIEITVCQADTPWCGIFYMYVSAYFR